MKVGIIMGGVSSEREVSLATGKEMMAHLDRTKYEAIPIEIRHKQDLLAQAKGIDLALLALHGSFGEDGTIQGTLETMGIPYTGCSLLSSALCMDKDVSKKLLRCEGLHTPDWVLLSQLDDIRSPQVAALGYPLVVKPNAGAPASGLPWSGTNKAFGKRRRPPLPMAKRCSWKLMSTARRSRAGC